MWVITSDATGDEIDRIESHKEAHATIKHLNNNEYGETYSMRWED